MAKPPRLEHAADAIIREMAASMYAIGDVVAAEAKVSITRGSVSGKNHVPSNPGDPPMNDTGDLAGGIEVHLTGPLRAQIVSLAGHSIPLEYGTSRMEARPFLRPAREAKRAEVQKHAAAAINRALRKFARR